MKNATNMYYYATVIIDNKKILKNFFQTIIKIYFINKQTMNDNLI